MCVGQGRGKAGSEPEGEWTLPPDREEPISFLLASRVIFISAIGEEGSTKVLCMEESTSDGPSIGPEGFALLNAIRWNGTLVTKGSKVIKVVCAASAQIHSTVHRRLVHGNLLMPAKSNRTASWIWQRWVPLFSQLRQGCDQQGPPLSVSRKRAEIGSCRPMSICHHRPRPRSRRRWPIVDALTGSWVVKKQRKLNSLLSLRHARAVLDKTTVY